MVVQIGQNGGREPIDPSQQVVRRDHLIEAKLVKELPLISVLPPHHRRLSCRLLSRNHCSLGSSSPFSTASAHSGLCLHCRTTAARSGGARGLRLKASRDFALGLEPHVGTIRSRLVEKSFLLRLVLAFKLVSAARE